MLERTTSASQFDQRIDAVHTLHRDFETRSRAVLKKVGALKYAADPSTEVVFIAFAVDDGPVQLWRGSVPSGRQSDPVPPEFIEAASDPNALGVRGPAWLSLVASPVLSREMTAACCR